MWTAGDYLTHRFNPELGIGRVQKIEGRSIVVEFSRSGTTLRLATSTDALAPVSFEAGTRVRVIATGEETTIATVRSDGSMRLASGNTAQPDALWPLQHDRSLVERLVAGDVDSVEDFTTRLDILHLLEIREAGGLGSFLGGRVRLFPHQLYVAERASAADPVRWLLADEVGLGKTIEAALILNRLVHTGRVQRCLIVVPEALTVQWLGELWRKYHQVFALLDEKRLADVARDFGDDANPFDVHRRAVIALETLAARPQLTDQAVEAGIDLLVVDEAQRLRRPRGHPGEPSWRAVAPIALRRRSGQVAPQNHVLLLTATPLEDDAHGFFRLLQLLRPDDFPEEASFEQRLATGEPLPPCTSATRRVDIGGLPPRVGMAIEIEPGASGDPRLAIEDALRRAGARDVVAQRRKLDRLRRTLASGAALLAVLGPDERALRQQASQLDQRDPRVLWLIAQARRWRDAGEKTLVFVAHRETLEMLRMTLSDRAQVPSGMFHEELPTARRDIEVARFRAADGPSLLVSTECGGEGRNFEFCRRLVLFDLPWAPSTVEQRIGRLDRIGRDRPVEIVYFRPPRGIGADVVRVFEALGLFREPLAGVEPQLASVEGALEQVALDPDASLEPERVDRLVAEARAARSRIREAAYQQLHRDPYRPDMAAEILARVPPGLDAMNEKVVATACARLGFTIERPRGRQVFAFELGHEALIDSLPGVPAGSSYVGTFNRETALEDETLDFFASGHALVEGVFAHFDESPIGRVARAELETGRERGEGLVAIYRTGASFEVVALDASGRARPDWAAAFRQHPLRLRAVPRDSSDPHEWRALAGRLAARLDRARRPHAIAAVSIKPALV